MAHDRKQIEQLARTYTEAWCSRDPAQVAGHYVPGGTIAINGGDATGIADVAEAFIAAFPDIRGLHGRPRPPGGRHRRVPLDIHRDERRDRQECARPGFEEWTIAPDGLIAESRGHYDQAEYDRQLQHGIGPAN